jgi:hypothetical protein
MVSYFKKNEIYMKEKKNTMSPIRVTCQLARPIQPTRLVRLGQLAGNSERTHGIFFPLLYFNFYLFFRI